MKKVRKIQPVSLCLCALALAIASTTTLAKERDREDRRGQRDHRVTPHAEVQRNQHQRKPSSKHSDCFECRIDRRQARQKARIRDGWVTGELTRHERKRLVKKQRKIARMERRFGADGKITRGERKRLIRAPDRASEKVFRLKHNDRYRHGQRYVFDYGKNCRWRGW